MSKQVARAAVKDIGYAQDGFHWQNASVEVHLHHQSVDIAQGVDAFGIKGMRVRVIRVLCLVTLAPKHLP